MVSSCCGESAGLLNAEVWKWVGFSGSSLCLPDAVPQGFRSTLRSMS